MKRTAKKQQVLRLPPHKQRKLKKIKREAMFAEEGRILGQYKAHAKKSIEESIKEHLGKIIDRIDPLDAALYGGIFAVGYKRFGSLEAALVGPIALKLATSHSEAAAVSGLVSLAGLGLAWIAPDIAKALSDAGVKIDGVGITPFIENSLEQIIELKTTPFVEEDGVMVCPVGWHKEVVLVLGVARTVCVKNVPPPRPTQRKGPQ